MFNFSLLAADTATWYPILFDTTFNTLRSIAIWLTVALVLVFAVCSFLLKDEKRKTFFKFGIPSIIVFGIIVGLLFLSLSFKEDGIVAMLFYPILVTLICVAIATILLSFYNNKIGKIISTCLVGASVLALLVCIGIYYNSGDSLEANWLTSDQVNTVGLYIASVVAIVALVVISIFGDRKSQFTFDTKSIAYAAITVAMSFALSYLRIVKMPQGGSITIASLLPIMIYAYMYGSKKGLIVGAVYGILQAFQDPYILHPAQFLLDYPVAFACVGLAGLFTQIKALDKYPQLQFVLGAIIAGVGRFIMHFLSGCFAFGAFAPEGTPVAVYSLTYQAAYVFPDLLITIVAGAILFSSKQFAQVVNKVRISQIKLENKVEDTTATHN